MKNLQDSFTLHNGVTIPCVGFGTWQTPDGDVCVASVLEAINQGYRHIDTAMIYGNEESVDQAIQASGVPRDQLFITSKLWNSDQGYESTLSAFEESLKRLHLDYLDLYLIHWPLSKGRQDAYKELNRSTWRAFEKLYQEGRIRAIGVSNFLVHHLSSLQETAVIKPMVNQIEYHPGWTQDETVAYCHTHDILIEAWSPLGSGKVFQVPELITLAEKYQRPVSQLCIRWCLQKNVLPLPKSVTPSRIKENANVFNFEISHEDMILIDRLVNCCGEGANPDECAY